MSETPWRTVHRRTNEHMLFAEDLGPVGSKVDVEVVDSGTIALKSEEGTTTLPWLAFRDKKKRLGLNRGNCKSMESIAGTNIIERWRGWITLVVVRATYTDKMTKQRLTTDAIRVAPERPRGRSAPAGKPRGAPDDTSPEQIDLNEALEIQRREAEEAARGH